MTATAPIVCKPLGTLPLAEVPAFPPAAARDLEQSREVRTLSDLQPHVEAQGGHVDAVRRAFIELGVRKEHLDQCVWSLLRHLNPGGVPEPVKKAPKPRAKKTDHGEGLTPAGPTDGTSAPASPSPTRKGEGPVTAIPPVAGDLDDAAESSSALSPSPTFTPIGTVDHAADIRQCQDCFRIGGAHEGDCKLTVACPICKAFPGQKCFRSRKQSDKPHKERSALVCVACGGTRKNSKGGVCVPCRKLPPVCTTLHHSAPLCTTLNAPEPVKPRTNLATDFDENTPPPRTRPTGVPVQRFVRLKPGESVVAKYLEWDKLGRIPAGSVLFERVWSDFGLSDPYMVAASSWPPPLGEPGATLSEAALAGWTARVVIEQRGQPTHVVMSREEAKPHTDI